jgi:uncharacterized protein (TIGR03435 family)
MQDHDDFALLRAYAERGSEEAFAVLVARHVNKVYSAALRYTGNADSAREITQAVFVILARKGPRLGRGVIVSGWLYQTVRWASVAFVRGAIRRRQREEEVCVQTMTNEAEPEIWHDIAPLLENAMGTLSEKDRHAVVLRFFDGKSFREVGAALGANEEAAKKRVARALEKLRIFFARRGVPSTTAVIASAISNNAVQLAPAAVAVAAGKAALAQGLATGPSISILLKQTLKLMMLSKLKTAALTCATVLLASGTAVVTVKAVRAEAQQAVAEDIFREFEQLFAQDIRGPQQRDSVVHIMTSNPHMAVIRRSLVPPAELKGKTTGFTTAEGHVQLGAHLIELLRYAYDLGPQFPLKRVIVPVELIDARYDVIDTLPQQGRQMLRQALKNQFGLIAHRETRGNLLLTVKYPAVADAHKHTVNDAPRGEYHITMTEFTNLLSRELGVKVTNQTGFEGQVDYDMHGPSPTIGEALKEVIPELGLDLAPASDGEQIDFLVAEKTR